MKLDGFHDCDKDEPWGRMKARKQKTGARDRGIKGPRRRDCGAGTAFQLLAIHCQLVPPADGLVSCSLVPLVPCSRSHSEPSGRSESRLCSSAETRRTRRSTE